MIHILCSDVRPTHGPLAQWSSNSTSFMWTSTASLLAEMPVVVTSSGGILYIGNPSIHGVTLLGVWGGWLTASSRKDNAGLCESSTPITVAIESDCGSLYASPSDHSMTASQSYRCCWLSGSASSSGSVCPDPSSLSSHLGSVSVVCGSGCHTSSSSDKEESGQLTIQQVPSLAIWAVSARAHGT